MGYYTYFSGALEITPTLKEEHRDYLIAFSDSRRMKRNPDITRNLPDKARRLVSLPVGEQGEFFVGDMDSGYLNIISKPEDEEAKELSELRAASIIDANYPPDSQPGLWCHWTVSPDGKYLTDNGAEKFYDYERWLVYLIDNFYVPWGYSLSGDLKWEGEERDDMGIMRVENNQVTILLAKINYQESAIIYRPDLSPVKKHT